MRSLLAAFLLLIGAILIVPATTSAWEQRTIMDRDGFQALGQDVLSQPEVQEALARRIAADIGGIGNGITSNIGSSLPIPLPITGGSGLAGGLTGQLTGQIFEQITLRVIQGLPGSPASQAAIDSIHRQLAGTIRKDAAVANEPEIVLDVRQVVNDAIQGSPISRLLGGTTLNLPNDTGRIVLLRKSDVPFLINSSNQFDAATPLFIIAPIVALILAVVISPNRPATLALAGILAIVTVALTIALLGGPLRGAFTDPAIIDPAARAAAIATYDETVASMRSTQIIAGAIGAAILLVGIVTGVATAGRRRS